MKEELTIYRLEHKDTNNSMWYNNKGEYNPFIMTLTEGAAKQLPMELDLSKYRAQGKEWICGTDSKELLTQWFSSLDAYELLQAGYHLIQVKSNDFIVEEFQTIFTRESITDKKELAIEEVWTGLDRKTDLFKKYSIDI